MHVHILSGQWSSPIVTGKPPPPCKKLSLVPVGSNRAAMYGGVTSESICLNVLSIVELETNSVVSVRVWGMHAHINVCVSHCMHVS